MGSKLKMMALVCSSALLLMACSGEDKQANTTAAASSPAVASQAEESKTETNVENSANRAEAYNKYVAAHNAISGMFYGSHKGIESLFEAYKAQELGNGDAKVNKNLGPILFLNTGVLGNMIRDLDAAQALKVGGDLQGLEQSAATLLATAKDLSKQGEDLGAYFTSKKYLDDQYAKAKTDNAAFESKWAQFNQEFAAFSAELDKVERQERLASIDEFTKAGKLREAASAKVFLEANDVLSIIESPEDLNNAEKLAKADEHMQKLEAALTELKTEADKVSDTESTGFKTTYDYFNSFTGNWRELKANKDASKFNEMVENYNMAVRFN